MVGSCGIAWGEIRRGHSRLALGGWSEGRSQPRAERIFIARVEKSSYKNRPKAGRSEKKSTAEGGTGSRARSEEVYIPKSPNRFASISARKSDIELLQSKDSTRVEGRGLPDTIGAEERGLLKLPEIEEQGLLGFLESEALSVGIKIRFTKPMSIIE